MSSFADPQPGEREQNKRFTWQTDEVDQACPMGGLGVYGTGITRLDNNNNKQRSVRRMDGGT